MCYLQSFFFMSVPSQLVFLWMINIFPFRYVVIFLMRLLMRVVFNVFLGLSCKVNKLRLHTKVSKVKIPLDVSKIMGKIFFVCQLRMVNKQILDYQFVPVGGNLLKIQNRRNTSHFGAHMLKVDKANNDITHMSSF